MSATANMEDSVSVGSGHKSLLLFGTVLLILAAVIAVEYRNSQSFQDRLVNLLQTNVSMLRVTLLACFGGSLISVPLLRRRNRRRGVPKTTLGPPVEGRSANVHPLMLTPRPSRDSSFVVRKTKKRGRISRNRGGERLPATIPE